jgi:predicted  nucleic acid-binding Zn-ribbon protein
MVSKLDAGQLVSTIQEPSTPPAVKIALGRVKLNVAAPMEADKNTADKTNALKEIIEEQGRLRANLTAVPRESEAYKRHVKKFDDQETEIEKRRAKLKELEQAKLKSSLELTDLLKELVAE